MKKMMSRVLAVLLSAALLAVPAAQALTPEQAYELLSYYYVDELPEGLENMTSVEEMIEALGDPYTTYMTQESYQAFISSINDTTLVGIGVAAQVQPDGIMVSSVLPGSPAEEAGIVAGDLITNAGGQELAGMGEAALPLIRGEEGTQVSITVRHANGEIQVYNLVRKMIVIPTTTAETLPGGQGYIECSSFGDETAGHFSEALGQYDSEVDSWIVDLRSNPGGTTDAAATSVAYFTGPGVLIYFRDGSDNYSYTFAPLGFPQLTEKQTLVLTSPYSASGAELFAGAARDKKAATLMGERTYGKGVAQVILSSDSYPEYFQEGDALKVTIYRFFSPDGTTNDKLGIIPHLMVSDETCAVMATRMYAAAPGNPAGWVRLTLDGATWYMNLDEVTQADAAAAFTEFLEAIPPAGVLEKGSAGGAWTETDASALGTELGLQVTPRTFQDLGDSPYADAINTLGCYGLLAGDGNGSFRPADTLTRGEFAAMAADLLRVTAERTDHFTDVAETDWYAGAVNALYEMGFAGGDGDGTFRPGDTISRQEMISVISRLGAWLNMDLYAYAHTAQIDPNAVPGEFSDWAKNAVDLCAHFNLLWEPAENISGTQPALRQEAAAMFYQLLTATDVLAAAD